MPIPTARMIRMSTRHLLCALLGSLALGCAADTFTAAADAYPPYVDPKNPTGGLAMEIIQAAYKTQGHQVTLVYMPWARAEASVAAGTYDLLPDVWHTDARAHIFLFSKPYASSSIRFIKRRADGFEYTGLNSLRGKKVGVVRGYGYGAAFAESAGFVREPATDLMDNLHKLLYQRIDLTLEDEIVARATIAAEDPSTLAQLEFVGPPLSSNPLHISASLRNPRHREIVKAFNRGLAVIRANGTLKEIFKKYSLEP